MLLAHAAGPVRTLIAGVGACLPEAVLSSSELEDRIRKAGVPISRGLITRLTGVEQRHVVAAGENASDLAAVAARQALGAAQLDPTDVDVLIFAAASHDVTEPATANIVQAKLGASSAYVFDLKNACNSVMSAVDVATAYVESGRARVVLVATGEVPSLVIDRAPVCRRMLEERFAHLTLGDAGGALVLVASHDTERGLQTSAALTKGDAWTLSTVLSFGTMHPHDMSPERALLQTRSCELEDRARIEMPRVMSAAMEAAGWVADDVAVVACHQHTRRIAHEICMAVGIRPDRVPLPLRYAGNAAAANIPLALLEAESTGRLVPQARVLLCGGSAGFSAMASTVVW